MGLFLAYSSSGGGFHTSPTGQTWTAYNPSPTSPIVRDIVADTPATRHLALGNVTGLSTVAPMMASTAGIAWATTSAAITTLAYRASARLASGRIVLIARSNSNAVLYSDNDAASWTSDSQSFSLGSMLATNGTTLVGTHAIAAFSALSDADSAYVSTDEGLTWASHVINAPTNGTTNWSVIWHANQFWALPSLRTAPTRVSTNGTSWSDAPGNTWPGSHLPGTTGNSQFPRKLYLRGTTAYFATTHGLLTSTSGGAWTAFSGGGATEATQQGSGSSVAISSDGQRIVTVGNNNNPGTSPYWRSGDGGATWVSGSPVYDSYSQLLNNVIWVEEVQLGSALRLQLLAINAGVFPKGRAALMLQPLLAPPPPDPPVFWARTARTRER